MALLGFAGGELDRRDCQDRWSSFWIRPASIPNIDDARRFLLMYNLSSLMHHRLAEPLRSDPKA